MKGVRHDITEEHFSGNGKARDESLRLDHLGLLAQEVEQVFQQLVQTDEDSGLKTVGYMGLIPVLVEGIKQQQDQIESLEAENAALQKQYEALEQRLSELEAQ